MNKSIIKSTIKLALPMASSRFFNVATTFLAIIILSQLGDTVLAASALMSAIQALLFMLCFSLLTSVSVRTGYEYGAKQFDNIAKVFQQGLLLSLCLLIPLVIICWNIGPILSSLRESPAIVQLNASYFRVFMWSLPTFVLMLTAQQLLLALHHQKFVFFVSFLSFLTIPVMSFTFVLGRFGSPKLGMDGLAVSYIINNILLLIIYSLYLLKNKNLKRYKLFIWQNKSTQYLRTLFEIGWPIAVNSASDLLAFVLVTVMIGWLGKTQLIAQQISVQYMILLLVPLMAIASASSILVSRAYGEKSIDDMRDYNICSLLITSSINIITLIVVLIFYKHMISAFVDIHNVQNDSIVKLASVILIIMICRQFFDATMNVFAGSLRGIFDTKYPMGVAFLARFIIQLPLVYFIGFKLGYGIIGMSLTSVAINMACSYVLWKRWQKMLLKKHQAISSLA